MHEMIQSAVFEEDRSEAVLTTMLWSYVPVVKCSPTFPHILFRRIAQTEGTPTVGRASTKRQKTKGRVRVTVISSSQVESHH